MSIKKTLIFSSIFLSFCLVGCGKKETTKKVTTTNVVTTEHVHSFGEWQEQSKATCSEEGFRKRKCACGVYECEITPKLPHTYVNDKCSVCGHETLTEGFHVYFSSLDEKYHIDDYTGESTTVRIPSVYDDGENGEHKVYIDKEVADYGFISKIKDCNIEKLIIGDGYQSIDDYMFLGFNNLKEVVIESSVSTIGDYAFYNCPKLSSITFSDGLEQIGYCAFASCDFKELSLPYDLKSIDVGAFSENVNLSSVSYYNNLKIIGDNAFNNSALETIKISYGLEYFGYQEKLPNIKSFIIDARNTKYDFYDDYLIDLSSNTIVKAIKPIEIPSTVSNIGSYSFAYLDYSEIDFSIPSNVEYIDFAAFIGSTFKSLTFDSEIQVIEELAFADVTLLDTGDQIITIPDTVKTILLHAFMGINCKKIVLPNSVTELDYSVFENAIVEEIVIHQSTLDSDDCDYYWDYGIDTDYTTITIIDD